MNPLNLDEPRFLVLYVPLLVLTFIGSVALRRRRRLPGGVPLPSPQFGGFRAYLQSSPAGMGGSSLDGTDFENSYNSYSDYSSYGSTDSGGGGDGGGWSDGGGCGGGCGGCGGGGD